MFEHILAFYSARGRKMIERAAGCTGEERWACFAEAERCNSAYTATLCQQVRAEK
jgi:hypothetical protein